jgi:hypothetical protein
MENIKEILKDINDSLKLKLDSGIQFLADRHETSYEEIAKLFLKGLEVELKKSRSNVDEAKDKVFLKINAYKDPKQFDDIQTEFGNLKESISTGEVLLTEKLSRMERRLLAMKKARNMQKNQFKLQMKRKRAKARRSSGGITMADAFDLGLKEVRRKMKNKLAKGVKWSAVDDATLKRFEKWNGSGKPEVLAKKLVIRIKDKYRSMKKDSDVSKAAELKVKENENSTVEL